MAKDPKKGTGKHPGKKYGIRLYTDENPRDTVKIKFATPTDARKTVAKVKKINKPFARKIQILTVSFGFSSVYNLLPEPLGFFPVPTFGSLLIHLYPF